MAERPEHLAPAELVYIYIYIYIVLWDERSLKILKQHSNN